MGIDEDDELAFGTIPDAHIRVLAVSQHYSGMESPIHARESGFDLLQFWSLSHHVTLCPRRPVVSIHPSDVHFILPRRWRRVSALSGRSCRQRRRRGMRTTNSGRLCPSRQFHCIIASTIYYQVARLRNMRLERRT